MTYESVIILSPQLDEEALRMPSTGFKTIKNGEGEVTKVDRWGKRRLAYEINNHTEGYFWWSR